MAVAAIDHPYICKIFEIGEDAAALFLVMEYVPGDTLDRRLRLADCRCRRPFAWPERSPRRSRKRTPAGFCTAI